MVPTLGGGTQDTDFNKGFTKGILQTIFGEEMGGQGDPDPLMKTNSREVVWFCTYVSASKTQV